jgi:hypothetical protein
MHSGFRDSTVVIPTLLQPPYSYHTLDRILGRLRSLSVCDEEVKNPKARVRHI